MQQIPAKQCHVYVNLVASIVNNGQIHTQYVYIKMQLKFFAQNRTINKVLLLTHTHA